MRKQKSRVFVVLLENSGTLDSYFLWRVKDVETQQADLKYEVMRGGNIELRDYTIQMLKAAGCAVRFYDVQDKHWKQYSGEGGLIVVSGNRSGDWGLPSLEEFERDYLRVL